MVGVAKSLAGSSKIRRRLELFLSTVEVFVTMVATFFSCAVPQLKLSLSTIEAFLTNGCSFPSWVVPIEAFSIYR